jgi:hypothetical protein
MNVDKTWCMTFVLGRRERKRSHGAECNNSKALFGGTEDSILF